MPKAFLLKRELKEEEGLKLQEEDEDTDEEDSWQIGRFSDILHNAHYEKTKVLIIIS